MSGLRHWLFDDLGLKLVALLLGVLVYLNAYTDRPASMIVTFRVQVTDLPDSLTLSGSPPSTVQAALRGTGKQLIRLRVTEPAIKVSLAGVKPGHFQRTLSPSDLPLPQGVEVSVDRVVSPRTLEMDVDRRVSRRLPVALRLEGTPAPGAMLVRGARIDPETVRVNGPASAIGHLDSLRLLPVSIAGKHDTLVTTVSPDLPAWTTADPARFEVHVPLGPAITRRMAYAVDAPDDGSPFSAEPRMVRGVFTGPREVMDLAHLESVSVRWSVRGDPSRYVGRHVGLVVDGVPDGVQVELEPDSVTLTRPPR